jgi:hypothetical protein
MFSTLIYKHASQIYQARVDWQVLELYNPRYPDAMIMQPVPLVLIDFKG